MSFSVENTLIANQVDPSSLQGEALSELLIMGSPTGPTGPTGPASASEIVTWQSSGGTWGFSGRTVTVLTTGNVITLSFLRVDTTLAGTESTLLIVKDPSGDPVLDAQYRPSADLALSVILIDNSSNQVGQVTITTAGNVTFQLLSGVWNGLSGIQNISITYAI
jgi:hypothetical protein